MLLRYLILFSALLLTSCAGYEYLNKGESVLVKQNIKTPKDINTEDVKTQLVQDRNTKLLGLSIYHLVYVYHLGLAQFDTAKVQRKKTKLQAKFDEKIALTDRTKKKSQLRSRKNRKLEDINDKLLNGNKFMQWGEKLAVFDSSKMYESESRISNYLFTKGYFNSEVSSSVDYFERDATVTYSLKTKTGYVMDSIMTMIPDPALKGLYEQKTPVSPLKGKKFDQERITLERERIYDFTTNNGYFEFKKQYILFEIDSSALGNQKILIRLTISNPPGKKSHKIAVLDSVIFNSESGKTFGRKQQTKAYRGITYNQTANSYAEKILDRRIFLQPDSLYSRSNTLETQRQLSFLDMFKFVNINYDTTGGKFIGNIFTSPLKKFQTSTELGISIFENGQGAPGPFFNFNAKNRNLFHRLEIINFDGNIRLQGVPGVTEEETQYSRFQIGTVASLTLPIFYFPLGKRIRRKVSTYNPKTRFSIGVNYEDRIQEYERTTFNIGTSYFWQVGEKYQYSIQPVDISYIHSVNEDSFQEELEELRSEGNLSYYAAYQSSFVSAASANFSIRTNDYGISDATASFFSAFIEYGGIVQNILGRAPFREELDLEYYKFVKFNADFRSVHRISKGSSFAYRVNTGFAYVFGESKALPYEKYFFVGGSNSIRAWSPRRLGPGAYAEYNDTDNGEIDVNYDREQPGDIIFESSIEYRRNMIGFISFAAFIDAGNIWLWNSQTINENRDGDGEDDGVFKLRSFVRELAVGTGVGLRFDFSFLILRLDGAWKAFDPAKPINERFVLDDIRFNNLFSNKVFNMNIGIGYPF